MKGLVAVAAACAAVHGAHAAGLLKAKPCVGDRTVFLEEGVCYEQSGVTFRADCSSEELLNVVPAESITAPIVTGEGLTACNAAATTEGFKAGTCAKNALVAAACEYPTSYGRIRFFNSTDGTCSEPLDLVGGAGFLYAPSGTCVGTGTGGYILATCDSSGAATLKLFGSSDCKGATTFDESFNWKTGSCITTGVTDVSLDCGFSKKPEDDSKDSAASSAAAPLAAAVIAMAVAAL